MSERDRSFYEILGVRVDASDKVILRAFRKLTRKHHPEVNPGDEASLMLYQEVCGAFSVLGDSRLREEYDRLGHLDFLGRYSGGGGRAEEVWPEELRQGFIGGLLGLRVGPTQPGEPRRGEDVRHLVPMSLRETARGITVEMEILRRLGCRRCECTCGEPGSPREVCSRCLGSGLGAEGFGPLAVSVECPSCGGRGYRPLRICKACRGEGHVTDIRKVTVSIPAGVSSGSEIRIRGLGHEGRHGGEPGDLMITTRVDEDPVLARKGDNIYSSVTIMVWEAGLGTRVKVGTLDGEVLVRIPPGTQSGQRVRLPGKGLPNLKTGRRGDHFVEIKAIIPPPEDEEGRRAYAELAAAFNGKLLS